MSGFAAGIRQRRLLEMSAGAHVWIRDEVKGGERRCLLTPAGVATLVSEGTTVTVEKSTTRVFKDEEYTGAGATLAESGSWVDAPEGALVCGLKELPEAPASLSHRHVLFGHAYKNQDGWDTFLHRFARGGGSLLDLEYVVDERGRRVAAFGRMAGVAGMVVALLQWCHQQTQPDAPLPALTPYETTEAAVAEIKAAFDALDGRKPRVIVFGALGRAGGGAVSLAKAVGIPEADVAEWDLEETKAGGPFPDILDYDIMVNCIFLGSEIPPFINAEMVASVPADSRTLSVVCDVSCDTTNPFNPLPIYNTNTTFDAPTMRVLERPDANDPGLTMISIDNLPSLLPREASEEFADALFPHFIQLVAAAPDAIPAVWQRSLDKFAEFAGKAGDPPAQA